MQKYKYSLEEHDFIKTIYSISIYYASKNCFQKAIKNITMIKNMNV